MLAVLTCGATYALPVGNPSDASLLCDGLLWEGHCGNPCDPCLGWSDAFSIRFGFYGDYVFNRHLRNDNKSYRKQIEHSQLFTNAGLITANFWDRLDIFTALGATNLFIDTNASAYADTAFTGARVVIDTETDFSWSLGARGTIWECGCTTLGAEFQYFETKPHVSRVTIASTDSIYPSNVDAKYREWQFGVGLAHRINIFVPYVAVKWSRVRLNFDRATFPFTTPIDAGTAILYKEENKKDWGYAVGVSLVDCEKASLTIEGRFAGEKALYVNGQVRF